MKRTIVFLILSLALIQSSDGQVRRSHHDNGFILSDLLVPRDEIYHGGPPKDGIPSIDFPKYITADKNRFTRDDDQVIGISLNGIARAYPLRILVRHEIVNTEFGNVPVAITYCPLCASGIAFVAAMDGERKTFGVSGLLYNSDVLLFDRETESLWSQIMMKAISGPESGKILKTVPSEITTWKYWKERYPQTYILSDDTGFDLNYDRPTYERYKMSKQLWYPVVETNRRFNNKDMVIGIEWNGIAKAYAFKTLKKHKEWPLVDHIGEIEIRIHYDRESKSARITNSSGQLLSAHTMYWFAWYAFHPDTLVYDP